MSPGALQELLERVERGEISVAEALEDLKRLPFADLGFARVDSHRELRSGVPEVVFAEGKTAEQLVLISRSMIEDRQNVLLTRLAPAQAEALSKALPGLRYNEIARTACLQCEKPTEPPRGPVAVVSAGTADQSVAEEAAETLSFLGVRVLRLADVGVAGIHRLLASRAVIAKARVAIVVAGMEGALPSVVGGLVSLPVIAVPSSVGYGASFGGLAALLAMLNSCAPGVTVVNIDNGFGAAVAASLILRAATSQSV